MKTYLEPVYKLQPDYTSYHNHRLPIDEAKEEERIVVKREPKVQNEIPDKHKSEQEKILSKIMNTMNNEKKRDKKKKKKHKKSKTKGTTDELLLSLIHI